MIHAILGQQSFYNGLIFFKMQQGRCYFIQEEEKKKELHGINGIVQSNIDTFLKKSKLFKRIREKGLCQKKKNGKFG